MRADLELLYATLPLRQFARATLPDYLDMYLDTYEISLREELIENYAPQIREIAGESVEYSEAMHEARVAAFKAAHRAGHTIPACFAAALSAKENDDA